MISFKYITRIFYIDNKNLISSKGYYTNSFNEHLVNKLIKNYPNFITITFKNVKYDKYRITTANSNRAEIKPNEIDRQENEFRFWSVKRSLWEDENYTDKWIEKVRHSFPFDKDIVKVSIGCGPTGEFHTRDDNLIGIDPLCGKYKKAGYTKWYERITGTGYCLPFADNSLDVIYCINAINHTEKASEILSEIHRCLSDKGVCYFQVDLSRSDGCHIDLTEESLLKMLDKFKTNLKIDKAYSASDCIGVMGELRKLNIE